MYKQYNTNQLSLKLNLAWNLPVTHEAHLISQFVDSIPQSVLSHASCPAFHPAMLLKITLFADARQVFSDRKIVQMNEEVIPMKWLSQDTYVCYRTINSFWASTHANQLVKDELTSEEGSRIYAKRKVEVEPVFGRMKGVFGVRRVHVGGQKVVETEMGFLLMSMNLRKLAKKLVQDRRNKKKNTDSSTGFHQNQLEAICVF